MPSLMERLRSWLGVDRTEEHVEVRRQLAAQQMRIKAIDAYIDARGRDRRRMLTLKHPKRRVTDA